MGLTVRPRCDQHSGIWGWPPGWWCFGEASVSVNVLCQVWWGTDHLGGALVLAKGAHLECLVVAVWKGSSGLVAGLAEQVSLQGNAGTE